MNDPTALSWIERITNICLFLVAIGVAGEFIGNWIAGPIRKRLDDAKDAEIARFNKQAAEAFERAATANERAAKAEQAVAEANRVAEQERLARVKIEERLAPRSLTPEQQGELREKLRPYAGRSVDIFAYGETPEILNLTTAITSIARSAGWDANSWVVTAGGIVTGILVGPRAGSDIGTQQAVGSLIVALNSVGLSASPWRAFSEADTPAMLSGTPWSDNKMAPIRMLIGTKP